MQIIIVPFVSASVANCFRALQELEDTYCPPLDAALFTAIVCDYDLANATEVQSLRGTLDALRLSAWEQEGEPFDPSGTSGLGPVEGLDADGIPSERSASQNGTIPSRETDLTSLVSDFSSTSLNGNNKSHAKDRSGLSERVAYTVAADGSLRLSGATQEDKIEYLTEMFPSAEPFTIQHTLQKSDGDVDRSMDVLLNLVFFDEQPNEDDIKVAVPKGIDGFQDGVEAEISRKKGRKRKGKNKATRNQELSAFDSEDLESPRPVNKWDSAQKDVDFIHSRTSPILKKEAVASAYHANGASLPATIRSLASAHAPAKEEDIKQDPVTLAQVAELIQEFPSISPTTFAGLLMITRSSTSAASELADAMLTGPVTPSVSELIKITAAPLPLEPEDETPAQRKAAARIARDYTTVQGSAGVHFAAGAEALSKASMAYKRGRSDRLMGGAAAYYSAVGRDHLERAKRNAAYAADALVDSQSGSNMLDLHGVSVQDAVRIASERVEDWWDSLGDAKFVRGGSGSIGGGYRIVTGVGRHSHDGTSRLGPAVGKMLAREGWRVEVGEGVLTVTGVVRRR